MLKPQRGWAAFENRKKNIVEALTLGRAEPRDPMPSGGERLVVALVTFSEEGDVCGC